MAGQAVGDAGASSSSSSTIPREAWETWLGELAPRPLDLVLAGELDYAAAGSLPGAYLARAFELAPQAAALAAGADAALLAVSPAPVLAQTPDGRLYYSAAGDAYRLVPPGDVASSLELNPSAVVFVDELELPIRGAWTPGSTPASAFVDVGRLVAAAGSRLAAYTFATYWRRRVA